MKPDLLQAIIALVTGIAALAVWLWKLLNASSSLIAKIEYIDQSLEVVKDDLEAMSNQTALSREQLAILRGEITIIRSLLFALTAK